jgi:hypothetical protein
VVNIFVIGAAKRWMDMTISVVEIAYYLSKKIFKTGRGL